MSARLINLLDGSERSLPLNRLTKLNLNHLAQIKFHVKSQYLENKFNKLYQNNKFLSPNQSKTWKTLLKTDNQNQSDTDNQNQSDTDNQNQPDTDPNQQTSMLEEKTDSFSQSNASQPDSYHNENNVSDTRRTRSGQIYACLSQAVQERTLYSCIQVWQP